MKNLIRKINITQPGKHVIELKKPGEEVVIIGIFETKDQEQASVEVIIHHQAPRTKAVTTLKGVVRDQSYLKLSGRIIIDPHGDRATPLSGGSQSSSFLTERILLLSDQARAEAVPDLEILTDDVVCSHAVSLSRPDERQLFYLMSRGLSKKKAEKLIVDGFLKVA